MIEFLQIIDCVLFLTVAYYIIKLSPLLEQAQFTNGQLSKTDNPSPHKQAILTNKPTRCIKVSYTSKFYPTSMTFAH